MGWWAEVGVLEYEHVGCQVRLDSIIIGFITDLCHSYSLFFHFSFFILYIFYLMIQQIIMTFIISAKGGQQ